MYCKDFFGGITDLHTLSTTDAVPDVWIREKLSFRKIIIKKISGN